MLHITPKLLDHRSELPAATMRESEVKMMLKGKQLGAHISSTVLQKNTEAAPWSAKCEKVRQQNHYSDSRARY